MGYHLVKTALERTEPFPLVEAVRMVEPGFALPGTIGNGDIYTTCFVDRYPGS